MNYMMFKVAGIDADGNALQAPPSPLRNFTMKGFVELEPTLDGTQTIFGEEIVLSTFKRFLGNGFDNCPIPAQISFNFTGEVPTQSEVAEAAAAKIDIEKSIAEAVAAKRPVALPRKQLQTYAGRTCPKKARSQDSRNLIYAASMAGDLLQKNSTSQSTVRDVTNLFKPVEHPDYGTCCTLDRGSVQQSVASQAYGLKIVTYISSRDFPSFMNTPTAGVRVAVHRENDFANDALSGINSAFVGAQSKVDILIGSSEAKRMQYPFGSDCVNTDYYGRTLCCSIFFVLVLFADFLGFD